MPQPSVRRLLPIVLVYLPVPVLGAIGSVLFNVGATPHGGPGDLLLSGSALAPPLFLPPVLLGAALLARRPGVAGRFGAGVASLVAMAFLAGSTANLPTDIATADAAGSPLALTIGMAFAHVVLAVTVLSNALPALVGRGAGQPQRMPVS